MTKLSLKKSSCNLIILIYSSHFEFLNSENNILSYCKCLSPQNLSCITVILHSMLTNLNNEKSITQIIEIIVNFHKNLINSKYKK